MFNLQIYTLYSRVEHNQPSTLLVKPGESFTISCKISGYALSDTTKAPSWIRHTQEKIIEFIGMIHAEGGIDYKDSLKGSYYALLQSLDFVLGVY